MRKSIDGLMTIIRDTYEMDPYSNALYLFCGPRCDRLKAFHFEKDGFVLLYKRLDNGHFQWPRSASEVRNLTRQEYRWLLEGLSIDQPKAIRPLPKRTFKMSLCKTEKYIFLFCIVYSPYFLLSTRLRLEISSFVERCFPEKGILSFRA